MIWIEAEECSWHPFLIAHIAQNMTDNTGPPPSPKPALEKVWELIPCLRSVSSVVNHGHCCTLRWVCEDRCSFGRWRHRKRCLHSDCVASSGIVWHVAWTRFPILKSLLWKGQVSTVSTVSAWKGGAGWKTGWACEDKMPRGETQGPRWTCLIHNTPSQVSSLAPSVALYPQFLGSLPPSSSWVQLPGSLNLAHRTQNINKITQ